MATNKEIKSNRLLQSRRFTLNGLADTQEAFTQVLDLNADEIYSEQNLIPTSSLPFSGSSQNGQTSGVVKYWFRHKLTKANDGTNEAWFFLSSYGGNDGVTPQLINDNQTTNFISPKYSEAALANANTEDATPGYNVRVFVSTNPSAPSAGDVRPVTDFTYNYKYGVLNFENDPPTNSEYVYITTYQYTGRTLASDITSGYSGSFSGSFEGSADLGGSFSGSFEGNGDGLTDIPASSIVGLNLTQIATGLVTASVAGGSNAFTVVSGSSTLLRLTKQGDLHVSASEFIGNNITAVGNAIITGSLIAGGALTAEQNMTVEGNSTFLNDIALTGSLEISQDLVVQGTASFGRINSVTGSAKIIGDAFIILNSDVPASRYAGILVEDSGSLTGQTGSLLYDAEADHWFYDSTAASYASGFIAGPRATRDNITWPSRYAVTRGDGGNHIVNSNIYSTGSYVTINKGGTGSLNAEVDINGSVIITGSTIQSSPLSSATTAPSDTGNYALVTSQSAWFYNHNAGVPRSNAWKSSLNGSYFNNFDHNTNVSEILRFVAGLLSASAPSPTANTKIYNSLSENKSNTGTTSNPVGFVPQSSTNTDIIYLNSKGWAETGSSIFNGLTIYNNSNYFIRYNSVAGGSTSISSSADAQLFGLGELDDAVRVSGSITFNFEQANDSVNTATSSSQQLIELLGSAPESSAGAQKNIINTTNPAVIPAAFQDGKFVNVFQSGLYNGGISFSSISSSGFYEINATIGISSSLASGYNNKSISERIFWSEVANGDFVQNSISHTSTQSPLTATSRSLSGAPYLQTATWNYQDTASGVFDPLYHEGTPIFSLSDNSGLVTIGGTTSQVMSGGNISGTSLVFDSTGATQRSAGTVPFETDIIKTSNTVTFNAGTSDNIGQSTISPTSYNVTAVAEDRDGTNISDVTTINFHQAGTFGQPSDSGSMAYYGRAQGYDPGSLIGGTETFFGEDFRPKIDNDLLSGSYQDSNLFTSATPEYYNLSGIDLQVKPGFLVRPGDPTYGYWLADPDNTKDYKFYARAFRVNTAYTTLFVDIGKTLNNWTSTSNGVSAAILFNSVFANGNLPVTFGNSNPVLFDISATTSTTIATNVANNDTTNPFTDNINIYGNNGGTKSSTKYGMSLISGLNQILNPSNTYVDFIVLVRYKGSNVAPVTTITQSNS